MGDRRRSRGCVGRCRPLVGSRGDCRRGARRRRRLIWLPAVVAKRWQPRYDGGVLVEEIPETCWPVPRPDRFGAVMNTVRWRLMRVLAERASREPSGTVRKRPFSVEVVRELIRSGFRAVLGSQPGRSRRPKGGNPCHGSRTGQRRLSRSQSTRMQSGSRPDTEGIETVITEVDSCHLSGSCPDTEGLETDPPPERHGISSA